MIRLSSAIIGGITVGLLIGAGATTLATTTKKERHRIMRDGRRAVRNAGHYIHDIFE